MTSATPQEKQVGRVFRDQMARELAQSLIDDPPTYTVPVVIALYRHLCPRRGNRSTALELKEIYIASPECGQVAAGRFAFIYRQGRCRFCRQTARSHDFMLVDGHTRPPLPRHVTRRATMPQRTKNEDNARRRQRPDTSRSGADFGSDTFNGSGANTFSDSGSSTCSPASNTTSSSAESGSSGGDCGA